MLSLSLRLLFADKTNDFALRRPDDTQTADLAKELELKDPSEPVIIPLDDDESGGSAIFWLIPAAAIVTGGLIWYFQKVQKDKAGRYKKTDAL